jgi:hypothetical protein
MLIGKKRRGCGIFYMSMLIGKKRRGVESFEAKLLMTIA